MSQIKSQLTGIIKRPSPNLLIFSHVPGPYDIDAIVGDFAIYQVPNTNDQFLYYLASLQGNGTTASGKIAKWVLVQSGNETALVGPGFVRVDTSGLESVLLDGVASRLMLIGSGGGLPQWGQLRAGANVNIVQQVDGFEISSNPGVGGTGIDLIHCDVATVANINVIDDSVNIFGDGLNISVTGDGVETVTVAFNNPTGVQANSAKVAFIGTNGLLGTLPTGAGAINTVLTSTGPNTAPIWQAPNAGAITDAFNYQLQADDTFNTPGTFTLGANIALVALFDRAAAPQFVGDTFTANKSGIWSLTPILDILPATTTLGVNFELSINVIDGTVPANTRNYIQRFSAGPGSGALTMEYTALVLMSVNATATFTLSDNIVVGADAIAIKQNRTFLEGYFVST